MIRARHASRTESPANVVLRLPPGFWGGGAACLAILAIAVVMTYSLRMVMLTMRPLDKKALEYSEKT